MDFRDICAAQPVFAVFRSRRSLSLSSVGSRANLQVLLVFGFLPYLLGRDQLPGAKVTGYKRCEHYKCELVQDQPSARSHPRDISDCTLLIMMHLMSGNDSYFTHIMGLRSKYVYSLGIPLPVGQFKLPDEDSVIGPAQQQLSFAG